MNILFYGGGVGTCFYTCGASQAFLDQEIHFNKIFCYSSGCIPALLYLSGESKAREEVKRALNWCQNLDGKLFFANWQQVVPKNIQKMLTPENLYTKLNNRVHIIYNKHFIPKVSSTFYSNEHFLKTLLKSSHIPFHNYNSELGLKYLDGGLWTPFLHYLTGPCVKVGGIGINKYTAKGVHIYPKKTTLKIKDIHQFKRMRALELFEEGYEDAQRLSQKIKKDSPAKLGV